MFVTIRDLNELPRPRVLVRLPDHLHATVEKALTGLAGTVRIVGSLDEVHLSEWDALITFTALGRKIEPGAGRPTQLRRWVPENLHVIVLQSPSQSFSDYLTDADRKLTLQVASDTERGNMAVIAEGLPDEIATLVRNHLAPLVADRQEQFGLKVRNASGDSPESYDGFQALLIGPQVLIYAAKYQRAKGSPVWVIPNDLPDFKPWFNVIFDEWHRVKPDTYFGAPDWFEAPEWMTPAEHDKADEIAGESSTFEQARLAHEERVEALRTQLSDLREASALNERQLVGGQNFELQEQVLAALRELGFDVEDMDQIWDPREPREDYRIRDPEAPGWMVIGDATGTTKGVKGTKLMTVERYVTKYVKENPAEPIPSYWLIANHFAEREPSARPADLVRGDELAVVEKDKNLVLDTVALFLLLVAARRSPALKDAIREQLRSGSGQFTAEEARTWIAAH